MQATLNEVTSIEVFNKHDGANGYRSILFTEKNGNKVLINVTGNTAALDALPKAWNFVDLDEPAIAAE